MEERTWTKWAAIAEIISSIAILITLVYLAVETNQNTDAILSTTRQASLEAELGLIQNQIDYPHIRPVLRSGSTEGLTPQEIEQVEMQFGGIMRVRENFWLQHENGVMDDETWSIYRQSLVLFIGNDFMRQQWEIANASGFYHPGFLAEINAALAQQP